MDRLFFYLLFLFWLSEICYSSSQEFLFAMVFYFLIINNFCNCDEIDSSFDVDI